MPENPVDLALLIVNVVVILGFVGFAVRFWQGHA
jgi:hypothetical protein